ncbi:MAG: serine protease [Pseudomonadota bacterium]|nr:serine protease [Pseudomonadota bacterium]
MNATGFVWAEPDHVVTALHAVAGCKSIIVYSEAKRKETTAKLVRADLKADLALLELGKDLGLSPLKHVSTAPGLRDEFYIWGYPFAAKEMIEKPIAFAGGLKRDGVTTLGSSFQHNDLKDLFRGQKYPTRNTKILRITSTIQPGHSGAPIFDRQGKVVAVADGGLLGGYRGINWSIPAHIYLSKLPNSKASLPKDSSKWAGLFSSLAAKESRTVEVPREDGSHGDFKLVRTISLLELRDLIGEEHSEYYTEMLDSIKSFRSEVGDLSFDIYEDSETGATVSVPTGLSLKWNPETRAIEAVTVSGAVRLFIGVIRKDSFPEAFASAQVFVSPISQLASSWQPSVTDVAFEDEYIDREWEWASLAGFHDGIDKEAGKPSDLLLSLTVSGNALLGYAVYAVGDMEKDLSDDDIVDYMLMQMGAELLSDFAVH